MHFYDNVFTMARTVQHAQTHTHTHARTHTHTHTGKPKIMQLVRVMLRVYTDNTAKAKKTQQRSHHTSSEL